MKGKNHSEVDDGDFYEYAFIFQNRDTLYTNSGFEIGRY